MCVVHFDCNHADQQPVGFGHRSKDERMCCKASSKFKKFLIELGGFDAKDVVVSYKSFKVMVRVNGKMVHVASFGDVGSVRWVDRSVINDDVCESIEAFLSDLE